MPIRICVLMMVCLVVLVQSAGAVESKAVEDGCTLVQRGEYARAVPMLVAQLKSLPGDHQAELCLGIALSRQGEKSAAVHLKRSLFYDPGNPVIHLELGRYYYDQQIKEEAEDFLLDAVQLAPQSPAAKEAQTYLQKLSAADVVSNWKFMLRGGLQYDSNVIINGEDQPLPAAYSGKADSSAVGIFKAEYSPIADQDRRVSLGYSLYQSLHAKLHEFDVTRNLFEVSGEQALSTNLSLRGLYAFEYLHLGEKSFNLSHRLSPELQWNHERFGSTILRYTLNTSQYQASSRFSNNPDRDGLNHQFGVTQIYPFSSSCLLFAGYLHETERAEVSHYSFDGHRLTAGLRLKLPAKSLGDISAEYDDREYRGSDPFFSATRHDQRSSISATFTKGITKSTGLSAGVAYTRNSSNIDTYDYRRLLTSLFLTAEF